MSTTVFLHSGLGTEGDGMGLIKNNNFDIRRNIFKLYSGEIIPRQARLDAPGTLPHVIIKGIEKRWIVNDVKDREDFVTRMGELALKKET